MSVEYYSTWSATSSANVTVRPVLLGHWYRDPEGHGTWQLVATSSRGYLFAIYWSKQDKNGDHLRFEESLSDWVYMNGIGLTLTTKVVCGCGDASILLSWQQHRGVDYLCPWCRKELEDG
jgi:hypothetical protein